ncbi:MAG TPA: Hpt domain-containing protein [Bryobacteraceae bacterium]|jgi:HPt (histidine-containing phosphotransfer) domain-containing protein|nr:Hpt domain-containing protein [Bryobacteraceae bacterium]
MPWTLPEDLRMLAEMGDFAVVREVISIFQTDTRARIGKLRQALADGDAARARGEAHAIKGSAAQVGALEVSELCRSMEAAAARQDVAAASSLFPQLEIAFAAVCSAMAKLPGHEGR